MKMLGSENLKWEIVLVLLPDSTQKLFAQWQGLYEIKKKIGDVNYQVDMREKKKQYRVFHINLLSKWYAPSTAYTAEVVEEVFDDEIPVWKDNSSEEFRYTTGKLSNSQSQQLYSLLNDYKMCFSHPQERQI